MNAATFGLLCGIWFSCLMAVIRLGEIASILRKRYASKEKEAARG